MGMDYASVYAGARAELEALEQRRLELLDSLEDLDRHSVALRQTMNAIAPLIGEELVPVPKDAVAGLTDSVRQILSRAKESLSASEIRERLRERGFSVDAYSNPLATVHTILRRLTDSGHVESAVDEQGTKRFEVAMGVMPLTKEVGVQKIAGKSFEIGKLRGFVGVGRLRPNGRRIPITTDGSSDKKL